MMLTVATSRITSSPRNEAEDYSLSHDSDFMNIIFIFYGFFFVQGSICMRLRCSHEANIPMELFDHIEIIQVENLMASVRHWQRKKYAYLLQVLLAFVSN